MTMNPQRNEGITFQALLSKISTTVDGGWNITLSVGQNEVQSVMQLSELREATLAIAVIPEPEEVF